MSAHILHIKGLDVIVGFDAASREHVYRHGQDLVVQGDRLLQVGGAYEGHADEIVSGAGLMAMPGLINMHAHPSSEPGNRGLLEELGSRKLGQSSLYEYMPIFRVGIEFAPYTTQVAVSEMLKSGVTTYVDMSLPREGWIENVAATGIRAVLGPMYRSAVWQTRNGHSVEYTWNEEAGRKSFEAALDIARRAKSHDSGRLSAMLCPSQIDTCSEELLKDSRQAALEQGMRLQIHAAQSAVEFAEMTRRHGRTPIEWLSDIGLLDEHLVIGHGIFLNDHPSIFWPQADDFGLLARSGASVAHCPTVFARRGIAFNYYGRYRAAGIRIGIGTDTFPHNLLDEMRTAMYASRIVARDYTAAPTADVFDSVTLTAASMLGRDDIGRLQAGCRADFSLVDLRHPYMRPAREPLRSLLYSASDRAIRDVYVGGKQVVRQGEVLTIDVEKACGEVERGQLVTLANAPGNDYAGRTIEQLSPMVLRTVATGGDGR
ncbi:amidohydrolase family protein [Variovorax sp. J31P207]|uniref:amidohydrolase family protein n=1 Tax=Variovorax sp. J31P207 TaxID=3053510 RepID=UPI002576565E|nr:amidohydrolase family protein [Variovorax sp. J31P207]MDM0071571.1 amidohydrolase family protein [Variovorax sp. J31P207]